MSLMKALFPERYTPSSFCTAIIAAAGFSQRMEGANKLLLQLGGKPVLAHTLLAVDATDEIDEIVIACREEDIVAFAGICKDWGIQKPVKVIAGGKTREESVLRAAMEADPRSGILAVHDGARPFATPELIRRIVKLARANYAAAPAIPVKDTIKVAEAGVVLETPNRSRLYAVQTPQAFDAELLRAALKSALDAEAVLTDDCSAVERLGKKVYLTNGLEDNIKITTPWDMVIAEAILKKRNG